ncbi:MAG: type II toxin-antitoxin system RelE/ParE family toxin [Terracidiphilus sp.]|jgi:mRNA interferase RelE/StbE
MAWTIELDPRAKHELDQLDRQVARRIDRFLFERIAPLENPRSIGDALKGTEFGDLWKYRVGDYRIIASIEDKLIRILVVRIGHRRQVYR